MRLRHAWYVVALTLAVLTSSACSPSPTATPTRRPTVPPPPTLAATLTSVPPSPTPVTPTSVPPTALPPTPTPIPPVAAAKEAVTLRQGPGTQYANAGRMPKDANAPILGKSEDGKWYQIAFPDAAHPSWVAVAFVSTTGAVEQLAVVTVTPPPTITPGGPVATRVPATATAQPIPPAKGTIGFLTWDKNSASYVLANVVLNPRTIANFILIGPTPFDLSMSTNAAPFAWAPDGSGRVAYVLGRLGDPASSPNSLHLYSSSTGADQTLYTHQGISSPSWSPDSRSIVYIGMDKAGVNYGSQSIYRISAGGGTPDRVFPARGNESFRGVTWGKTWILFVSNQNGYYEIWRLDADFNPGSAFPVTNDRRENGSPAWSPDGTRFAYYSKQVDGSYQIMVANADGSGQRKLTNAGNNFTPTWSPDGNWIAFESDRGGRLDIYIMDKNGGNVQVLTDKYVTDCPPPQCQNQLPQSWR